MDARAFIAGFIGQHEGGLSKHPADNGNWYDPARYNARPRQPQRRGLGVNVGSKFGVTAYALNAFRRAVLSTVVMAGAMSTLTLDQAVDIGMRLYYEQPGFSKLPWNRVTASILDKAWGSGPETVAKMVQRMVGVSDDGAIGPATVTAYTAWLAKHGEEEAAALWADRRITFDHSLVSSPTDPDRAFIGGWDNRTRSFLPGTAWWRAWDGRVAA